MEFRLTVNIDPLRIHSNLRTFTILRCTIFIFNPWTVASFTSAIWKRKKKKIMHLERKVLSRRTRCSARRIITTLIDRVKFSQKFAGFLGGFLIHDKSNDPDRITSSCRKTRASNVIFQLSRCHANCTPVVNIISARSSGGRQSRLFNKLRTKREREKQRKKKKKKET